MKTTPRECEGCTMPLLDETECPNCGRPTDGTPTRECDRCDGSGFRPGKFSSCRTCRGLGWVRA